MGYYEVLGVSKTASPSELKKAYRTLALENHPDRNQGEGSEAAVEVMKEINEAYGVLSDPQKRESFDRFGLRERGPSGPPPDMADFLENLGGFGFGFTGFGRQPGTGPLRGGDVVGQLQIVLSEALFGTKRSYKTTFSDTCSECHGAGFTKFEACEDCGGHGRVHQQQGNMISIITCRGCGGVGKFPLDPCPVCVGKKTVQTTRELEVLVPAGVHHGATLRLAGQGQAGVNGGPPGDVLVRIRLKYPDVSKLTKEQLEFIRSFGGESK